MSYKSFSYEVLNHVARIQLSNPDRGNPIDENFCQEYKQLSIECAEDNDVRAVLITGSGRFFCVGGDIQTFLQSKEKLPEKMNAMTSDLHMAVSRFASMDAPVVMAVHSLVAGAAIGLCAAADFTLASPDCEFVGAFSAIGFSCDCGTSYYLPRRVGSRNAAEMLMLNQKWSAQKALEAGLINAIVESESLYEEASEMAEKLAAGAPLALGNLKRLLLSSYSNTLEMQLEDEARCITECCRTQDSWDALNAFKNKQKPVFHGR